MTRPGASRPRDIADEAGFAVPTVMLALIAAFALASATVVASVNSQRGTVRDQNSKQALAAAEAGVSDALLSFNRIAHTQPICVVGTVSGEWCMVEPQPLTGVAGASYSYAVRPTPNKIEIVSTGVSDGVTRRVDVVARSSSGNFPFAGDFSVIADEFITVNNEATINANLASNGDINLVGSGGTVICDNGQVGEPDGEVTGPGIWNCPPPGQGTEPLPPINQGDVATSNSNSLIPADPNVLVSGGGTYTHKKPVWEGGDPTLRKLRILPNSTLSLPTGNYSLCTLTMDKNATLFAAAGATVRIYFDSPEACGHNSTTTPLVQVQMNSSSRITTTGVGSIELLFVGSETVPTQINFAHNSQVGGACEQDFIIYAPLTDVVINADGSFCGAIAADSITLNQGADVFSSNLADGFQLPNPVAEHYGSPEDFIECSATGGPTPDDGC